MKAWTHYNILLILVLCISCTLGSPNENWGFFAPNDIKTYPKRPENADEGDQCWNKDTIPAVIETTTRRVIRAPATLNETDDEIDPSEYEETTTDLKIVKPREARWFETPCPKDFNTAFIATLQRSLNLRGLDAGQETGEMTSATRAAIRTYQKKQGLNSSILSLSAARKLGLIAYTREDIAKF